MTVATPIVASPTLAVTEMGISSVPIFISTTGSTSRIGSEQHSFTAEYPDATPQEIMNMTLSSSSKANTQCDGPPGILYW